jgi:zinc/manganese transport system ATP-binding protein
VTSPTLIHLDRVTLGYGQKVILRDITVTIRQGEYLGLVGPNGAGKTTLLKAILGILKPSGGTRTATHPDGRPLRFGYVPQRDSIDSVSRRTQFVPSSRQGWRRFDPSCAGASRR